MYILITFYKISYNNDDACVNIKKSQKNTKNEGFGTPTLPKVGTCTRGFWAQFTKGKMAFFDPFSALFLSSGPP